MKLFTSLLSSYPDFNLDSRWHNCKSQKQNPKSICWNKKGHGNLDWEKAILLSCNEYFGSLTSSISFPNFYTRMESINNYMHIRNFLPNSITAEQFPGILTGLNFSMEVPVLDLMRLAYFLSSPIEHDPGISRKLVKQANSVRKILENIYTEGTANAVHTGTLIFPPENLDFPDSRIYSGEGIWGKTSTMVTDTNRKLGYGVFLGGHQNTHILVLVRNGNGWVAANWARSILKEFLEEKN